MILCDLLKEHFLGDSLLNSQGYYFEDDFFYNEFYSINLRKHCIELTIFY